MIRLKSPVFITAGLFLSLAAFAGQQEKIPRLRIARKANMDILYNYYSHQLGNARTVRILVPDGYYNSGESYPVLYMYDGQNLFSPETATYGMHWRLGETLRRLSSEGKIRKVIVVGIDSTDERIAECTPDKDSGGRGGKAGLFAEFLARELIPYVDTNYRTLRGPEHRAFAGASLGGLEAFYLAVKKPGVFGMAAALSPYFDWNGGSFLGYLKSQEFPKTAKIWADCSMFDGYFSSGAVSSARGLAELNSIFLEKKLEPEKNFLLYFDEAGEHNEISWGARFEYPLIWFFGPSEKPSSVTPLASASQAGINGEPELVMFRARLEYPSGLKADIIPGEVKSTPPYFNWENGFLRLRNGAEPGRVKVYFTREGKELSAKINVAASLSAETELIINAELPQGTPPETEVFISGSIPAFGNWNPSGAKMEKDPKNALLRVFKTKLKQGGSAEFKFTRGGWDNAEKAANGRPRVNRSVIFYGEKQTLNLKIERW